MSQKKTVSLPPQLRAAVPPKQPAARKKAEPVRVPEIEEAIGQITMEELMDTRPEEPARDETPPIYDITDGE